MSKNSNQLIIVAGPNGSGKTTLAKEYLVNSEYVYLSADEIAYEINPENPSSVSLEAGREFFKRFNTLVEEEKDLLIESTLSGKTLKNKIKKIQADFNYIVTLVFIGLR